MSIDHQRSEWYGREISARLAQRATAGVVAAAAAAAQEASSSMGSEGGGVLRKTKRGRNVYYAAPAGKYPGIRTGLLRRSITFRRGRGSMEAQFGTTVKYGRFLEFGWMTPSGTHVPARPWARRTVRLRRSLLLREFLAAFRKHGQ